MIFDAELESTARVGYLKMMLTGMLYLAKLGYVLPVLHTFEDWLHHKNLDMSLIRTFLYRLLSTIQAPYSNRFVFALANIILDSKVTEAISSSSLASSPVPSLVDFLHHVTKTTGYGLSKEQMSRLRQMHNSLSLLPG
uniref:Uncharacterized protein n=2 Tax=Eutreptiella gymnastica TaxID=73025 RepID=A0A7S1IZI3_9EUGL|mmetsp:Transcript_55520/g.98928  ORF Transcript_55520/g.98928 Transcript_55520/m.98928 type:complete len:138 (+) Transcript_55520:121-534(+)